MRRRARDCGGMAVGDARLAGQARAADQRVKYCVTHLINRDDATVHAPREVAQRSTGGQAQSTG
jgi:hypothetical protein